MVNQDKVILMTKLEIAKESDRDRALKTVSRFNKNDYVAIRSFGTFILGSVIYWGALAGGLAYLLIIRNVSIALSTMAWLLVVLFVLYIVAMFIMLTFSRRAARKYYDKGRKLTKELYSGYKRLLEDDSIYNTQFVNIETEDTV